MNTATFTNPKATGLTVEFGGRFYLHNRPVKTSRIPKRLKRKLAWACDSGAFDILDLNFIKFKPNNRFNRRQRLFATLQNKTN